MKNTWTIVVSRPQYVCNKGWSDTQNHSFLQLPSLSFSCALCSYEIYYFKKLLFLFFTTAMFFTIATIFLYHVCLEISLEIENCYENLSWMSVKLQQLYSKCVWTHPYNFLQLFNHGQTAACMWKVLTKWKWRNFNCNRLQFCHLTGIKKYNKRENL